MPSASDLAVRVRKHLPFLDGIRGVAAMYVVAMHAVGIATNFQAIPGRSHYLLQPLFYGQIAVSIFIVLSGYCLALPYLRSGELAEMDRLNFCRKRAWRILPPYYAALVLSVAVALALALRSPLPTDLNLASLTSHLFLVHDVKESWYKAINQPMWSVAVEWHIYFIFAFALFPLWRRVGILSAVATALVFGVAPHFLLRSYNFDWAHPWYLFSFAIGMLGASLTESDRPQTLAAHTRNWNTSLVVAACVLLAALYAIKARLGTHLFLITDTLEGAITALVILRFEHGWRTGARSPARRLFESQAALGLGAMSYSLYLFHWPVLVALDTIIGRHLRPEPRCWFLLLVGGPMALLVSFASYLAVERPLISKRHRVAPLTAVREHPLPAVHQPSLLIQP
jgi:peptidoglycan/LPS O-acetylase OafA/YrhL